MTQLCSVSTGFASALCLPVAVLAQSPSTGSGPSFPVKPMRIIVPVQPGGGLDPQARLLGKKFQDSMGQTVVIENRPGAGSMIGTEYVAKSPADGYTLLCAAASLASAVTLYRKLPFDLQKDLLPVSQLSSNAQFLIAHPSLPAATLKEFIALARKQAGKLNAASGGTGTANHLVLEMFKQRAGFQATHVPYKGSGPATIALMSGEVDFSFAGAISMIPHLRSGKVKALAVTSPAPSRMAPALPTLASLYPGFESVNWYGIFAPAATPAAIVNKLGTEIAAAIKSPEMRDFMHKEGADPVGSTPQEFAAYFRSEVARYAQVIQAAGVRVE
jgi:tripartite-type tricarboxylate transporter receptor subunit TctC